MSIKEFAEKFIEAEYAAWQEGNFEALESMEIPDVVWHILGFGLETAGWEQHKKYVMGVRMMMPNIKQELTFLAGDGNLFALSYKAHGSLTGQILNIPSPMGNEVDINSLMLLRLENGKIAEAWTS